MQNFLMIKGNMYQQRKFTDSNREMIFLGLIVILGNIELALRARLRPSIKANCLIAYDNGADRITERFIQTLNDEFYKSKFDRC